MGPGWGGIHLRLARIDRSLLRHIWLTRRSKRFCTDRCRYRHRDRHRDPEAERERSRLYNAANRERVIARVKAQQR
jgi:hypothetical protein